MHINLTVIFYTHVEHGPTKTIHIKYYTETHKDIARSIEIMFLTIL